MYRNTAGTAYDMYSGWFVDATHVVTAGIAVAPGGTGKYNVFSVKGRYGIVCYASSKTSLIPGGPDSCPAQFTFNITKAVTTTGWLSKNQLSNSGAVLKVVGLTQPATFPYRQANPLCFTDAQIYAATEWSGYVYPSTTVQGCSSVIDGAPTFYTSSYTAMSQVAGTTTCTPALDSPYWSFFGGSCAGTLGGPLHSYLAPGYVGILTSISSSCDPSTLKSRVGFTAVTNGGTAWGVAVSRLVAALP
jgi:hypothetical protein